MAHAVEGEPEEVCGILSGEDHTVRRVYRGINAAADRLVRYEMDPRQQLEIMRQIDADGEEMVAIYHSHPRSSAYPSRIDLELAYYPDSAYVIVSLSEPGKPEVRAYRIKDGTVTEEPIIVDDGTPR